MLYMEKYHNIGCFVRCFKIYYFLFCCDFRWQLNELGDWILDTYDGAYHFVNNDSLYFEHDTGVDVYLGRYTCELSKVLDFNKHISSYKPIISKTYEKIYKLGEIGAALQRKINLEKLTPRKERIYVREMDRIKAKMNKLEAGVPATFQKLLADFKNISSSLENTNS